MNIGAVAERSGVAAKTIRYYEDIGLIHPAERRANGYRAYSELDARELKFIQRARSLGFSVEEVRELLDLWRDKTRSSILVRALASRHVEALDRKIGELEAMRRTLAHLIEQCQGDASAECPILDMLDEKTGGSTRRSASMASTAAKAKRRRSSGA